MIIALLVRVAINAIMDRAFVNVLTDHMSEPSAVRAARSALGAFGSAPDIEYACRGEAVMGRQTMRVLRSGKPLDDVTGTDRKAPLFRVRPSPATQRLFCDASEARMINYWRRVFDRLRRHRGDYIAQGRAFGDLDREIQAKAEAKTPSYILLAVLTPVFEAIADNVAREDALRRLREGLVRIAEYRLRSGRLPPKLAACGGTPLLDPFTGKPLTYRRTDDGFAFYSVGENRKDDGGNGKRPEKGGKSPDIVIRYPRQAQ